MKNRPGSPDPAAELAANERLCANLRELMTLHNLNQSELAERIQKSQPWLSKRLTGETRFQVEDLDALGHVFGLSPAQLLEAGYGNLDRRSGEDRRHGVERRRIGERFQSPRGRHRLPHRHDGQGDDDGVPRSRVD